ncbi:MAG: sugar ABC transporter ATP-binding protein [Synergistaceae bacterium]|jgi:ribose transport system ATP-binding protein|nr:sugar ABC transporter ATP-binding protein [Synergistaceae bacterium]
MDEIFTVADSITIMRDGEVTGGGTISDFTVDRVVELMIGRKLDTMYPARSSAIGAEALRVENLTCGAFKNISFTLRKGEILGLFGLVGSGRSELAHAIFGEIRPTGGIIYVEGSEVGIHSPYQGRKHGIALIPEDRKEQGLVLDMPIRQNMTMTDMKKVCGPLGVILPSRERDVSDSLIKRLSVKTGDAENRTDSLSGGNQQKVVFAKWLNTDSEIMIMDEPTRGVDVGAKVEIYGIMNALAARGTAILMISSELNEIIGMCDRTLVIDNGEIKGELSRDEMSESKAMKLVVGGV